MDIVEKHYLEKEATMQIEALRKINIWKNTAIAGSTLGVATAYAGMAGTNFNIFLTIPGVIITLLGLGSAVIFTIGLKNGRRNVGKMLSILEEGKPYEV